LEQQLQHYAVSIAPHQKVSEKWHLRSRNRKCI